MNTIIKDYNVDDAAGKALLLQIAGNMADSFDNVFNDLLWDENTIPSELRKLTKSVQRKVIAWHNDAMQLLKEAHQRDLDIAHKKADTALQSMEVMRKRYEKDSIKALFNVGKK